MGCPSTSPSVSPPTCGPTPVGRPSPSASSTTGRSSQAAPSPRAPSPTRSSRCAEEEGAEARLAVPRQLPGQNVTCHTTRLLNWGRIFFGSTQGSDVQYLTTKYLFLVGLYTYLKCNW